MVSIMAYLECLKGVDFSFNRFLEWTNCGVPSKDVIVVVGGYLAIWGKSWQFQLQSLRPTLVLLPPRRIRVIYRPQILSGSVSVDKLSSLWQTQRLASWFIFDSCSEAWKPIGYVWNTLLPTIIESWCKIVYVRATLDILQSWSLKFKSCSCLTLQSQPRTINVSAVQGLVIGISQHCC